MRSIFPRFSGVPALFFFCALALSCSLPTEGVVVAADGERPDAVFRNFSRDEVEDGVVVFSAKAAKAEYFRDSGLLVVYDVTFEDRGKEGGSPKATGEADKVVYHEDTGDAEFSGFVRLYSKEEDASFETSELKYLSATQTIEGGAGSSVIVKTGSGLFLRGMGFFADIQSKAFAFRNGAQGLLSTRPAAASVQGVTP